VTDRIICYNNPQGFIDPLGLCAIKNFQSWLKNYAPDGLLDAIGITILSTLNTVVVGILNSPHDIANQIYDFVHDPLNPNKIPILGPLGQAIGLTTAMAFDNPNAVTISQAIGAYSSGVLTALGGSAIKGRLNSPKGGGVQTLYRGVRTSHPGFKNAVNGVVKPRSQILGHSNPMKHNLGNTKSKLTSWTTDRNVAKRFSRQDGVILKTKVPVNKTIKSPDLFNESEVLLKGTIKGVQVTTP
jgi:hypothetical protein